MKTVSLTKIDVPATTNHKEHFISWVFKIYDSFYVPVSNSILSINDEIKNNPIPDNGYKIIAELYYKTNTGLNKDILKLPPTLTEDTLKKYLKEPVRLMMIDESSPFYGLTLIITREKTDDTHITLFLSNDKSAHARFHRFRSKKIHSDTALWCIGVGAIAIMVPTIIGAAILIVWFYEISYILPTSYEGSKYYRKKRLSWRKS